MKKYFRNFVPIILVFAFCLSGCRKHPKVITVEKPTIGQKDISKPFPASVGYVNDFAYFFTPEQRKELEEFLTNYEAKTTNEIAIATLDSIPDSIRTEDYARDLANYWGVGKVDKNNGLLILMSMFDRKISIQTGVGTHEKISDEFLKSVIDSLMAPKFQNEEFYEGVRVGLDEIIKKWE